MKKLLIAALAAGSVGAFAVDVPLNVQICQTKGNNGFACSAPYTSQTSNMTSGDFTLLSIASGCSLFVGSKAYCPGTSTLGAALGGGNGAMIWAQYAPADPLKVSIIYIFANN